MTTIDAVAVDPSSDHRVQLEAVYWCFVGISTIFIGLRIWTRVSNHMSGVDDWLMVACWLSFIATGVLVTLIAESGGTRHEAALTVSELEYQIKLQTINLIFWMAATLFGKMAIGLNILRILERTKTWYPWPIYIVIHLTNITCILDTCLIFFRCGEPGNVWNLRDQSSCLDGRMVHNFSNFAAAWQVFVDFFLAFFPMYIISTLQMERRRHRQYTIMGLLGLMTFTGVVAAVKTAVGQTSLGKEARDLTWDFHVPSILNATEIMLLIVFGSVPIVFRLWDELLKSLRQVNDSLIVGSPVGKYFKWSKESELPQTKKSIENADHESFDHEEPRKAVPAELSSDSHTRYSVRYLFGSKQDKIYGLSGRWSRESGEAGGCC